MIDVVRGYQAEDFGPLRDLINAAAAPDRTMTDSALREFLDYPWFRPETDLFVAPVDGGAALAAARDVRVWARGDEIEPILESWGATHPGARDNAAARAVFRAALARAGEIVRERGARRGILQARCNRDDRRSIEILESM